MPAYRMVETKFLQPTLQPVPGAPAQGEWVNGESVRVLEHWGQFRRLSAKLVDSPLGQVGRQRFRWRGQLPDEVEPECGWELEIGERRFCIIAVQSVMGRIWQLDLERM